MNISVIGTGYVGLVTGSCFAEMGNTVICVDNDVAKVKRLERGDLPIHEPGLDEIVASNVRQRRLRYTTSLAEAVASSNIYFIAVGTPPNEDGSADLSHVLEVAREIGGPMCAPSTIVDQSPAPLRPARHAPAPH